MTGTTVLVTGAGGRVGRHVVNHLTSSGYRVLAHDARGGDHPPTVTTIQGRLADLRADDLHSVEVVVHLAALMRWGDDQAAAVMDTNVTGTFRLLRAAAAAGGVRRVVFTSSGEVYPETAPQFLPLDENHPRLPTNHYGLSKVLGEELVSYYRRTGAFETVILRLCHVQDPAEMLDPDATEEGPRRFFLAQRLLQELTRGNTDVVERLRSLDNGSHQLLAVRRADARPARMGILAPQDIAEAIRLAIESGPADGLTLGVGPDESVDLADFAHRLGDAARLPVVDIALPGREVDYWTLNCRAREVLAFRPTIGYEQMVERAAAAWRVRSGSPRDRRHG